MIPAQKLFWLALAVTLPIRLLLAAAIPISGDEAYFVQWARNPDWGFYDHPPMVGWWLAAMLAISDATWWLRLPAVLVQPLAAWAICRMLSGKDETAAWLAATVFLVSPWPVLNVLVTTDTPLILFLALSALLLTRALESGKALHYAFSGVFLGLAFLSKYFAVLLGLAYLAFFAWRVRKPGAWKGFALLVAASLPFAALNLWWNHDHCWNNLLFNLVTRNRAEGSILNMLAYLGMLAYLALPLLWFFWRERAGLMARLRGAALPAALLLVPLLILLLLSHKKLIGLHWVLGFYAFLFVLAGQVLSSQALRSAFKATAIFTALHLAAVAVVALLPMDTWKNHRLYDGIVFMFKPQEVLAHLHPYEKDFVFATDGYTAAAMAEYHAKRRFIVFGEGSFHARQDDTLTDFRTLDGRNILILRKTRPAEADYAPYFQHLEIREIPVHDAVFYLVLGYDFRLAAYRERVLTRVAQRFYAFPAWLPRGRCEFCERYALSCGTDQKQP